MIRFLTLLCIATITLRAEIQLVGITSTGDERLFSLRDTKTHESSSWIKLGRTFSGYILSSFDSKTEILTLEGGPEILRVGILDAKITVAPETLLGDADPVAVDQKDVTVIGTLKSFLQDGYQLGWDSLVFSVDAPARLKGKAFTVLVYPRPNPRSAADRKDAEAYWKENIGRKVELTVEEAVLLLPEAAPNVFTCGKVHLDFQKPNQSLQPTAPSGRG